MEKTTNCIYFSKWNNKTLIKFSSEDLYLKTMKTTYKKKENATPSTKNNVLTNRRYFCTQLF